MALSLQRYSFPVPGSTYYSILKERTARNERPSIMEILSGNNNIGVYLPEHLMIEILSWLPVKQLLKYKCVSKSWHSIISSPKFVSMHLKHYYANNDDWRSCLLVQYIVGQPELVELLIDDETPRVLANQGLDHIPYEGSYMYGPCDGLYYLYHRGHSDRILWNPVINYELKVLPPLITKPNPPPDSTFAPNEFCGFGFDVVTEDYKVVVIKGYWTNIDGEVETDYYPLSVFVYASKTHSWKYCGDFDQFRYLKNNTCYICVNGRFYWLAMASLSTSEQDGVIVSFDMATDLFQELYVKLPNYQVPASITLGVYHNSLALYTLHNHQKILDVWTLNDENGLFWTKVISVGPLLGAKLPIGHWKDDKLILRTNDHKLILCDLETKQVFDLSYARNHRCLGVFAYMESLVSIKNNTQIIPSNRCHMVSLVSD